MIFLLYTLMGELWIISQYTNSMFFFSLSYFSNSPLHSWDVDAADFPHFAVLTRAQTGVGGALRGSNSISESSIG